MSKYNCELNLEDRNSLSVLVDRVKPNSIVLEFGPANGRMTKYMKEQLSCKVYAVEIDENAAKDAEQYTEKIIVDSIENYRWQEEFKHLRFDYIIFADVLEHLYYPEKVLKSVKEFLRDNGSILVSIPNISHNSIIINLLKNEFNYNPTGLLDDTHIRFFTKKTFDKLIKNIGCFTSYETAIFMDPKNTEFRNSYSELTPKISRYLQKLPFGEVYQLIYEIKKYEVTVISDFSDEYKFDSNNFIQTFIGDENGITAENSITKVVEKNHQSQKFEFDISDRKNISLLRIDPLDSYCIININNILLDDVEIKGIRSNACYIIENMYYFNTIDPQIEINVGNNQKIDKLTITLEYLYVGEDAVNQIVNDLLKELITKKKKIQTLSEELVDIYLSKSWKITRPLRNFVRKLRRRK